MAHKKGQGSTRNGRDSNSQRRGTKVYGGEKVRAGQHPRSPGRHRDPPGRGVGIGRDFTLFALRDGVVKFTDSRNQKHASVVDPG